MSTDTERIAKLEANDANIFHQLDEIKEDVKDIHRLTSAVEKIALRTESIEKKVDGLDGRIGSIEAEPGQNWRHYKRLVIGCILTGAVGAILGAILTMIIH